MIVNRLSKTGKTIAWIITIVLVIIIGIFIYLSSKESLCKITEKYNNGCTKTKLCYIDSQKGQYRVIHYYDTQMPMDTFYYNADTITYSVSYDKEGIRCITEFVKGQPNGNQKCYYNKNILYSEGHLYNGNQIGEWKFFYQNGSIKSYEYFAGSGKRVFLRKYKTDGTVEKSMGKGIAYVYSDNDTILSKGQNYRAAIFLVNPPDCKVTLSLARLDDKGGIVKQKEAKIENSIAYVNFKSEEVKTHKIAYIWEIHDLQGKLVDKGEYLQTFVVK
jgi:Uncharacterized protein conserved in bacteria